MTPEQVEELLDSGKLQILAQNGRYYTIRRNGATKRWKRSHNKVDIPCKVGFREAFRLVGENGPGIYYGDLQRVWRWSENIRIAPQEAAR